MLGSKTWSTWSNGLEEIQKLYCVSMLTALTVTLENSHVSEGRKYQTIKTKMVKI